MPKAVATWALIPAFALAACKQGSPAESEVLGDQVAEPPGPEAFETGPTVPCEVDGLVLTLTFGPPGDFKWARLSDAPVASGTPRIEYLQSDSSRIRRSADRLVSGRWQKSAPDREPIEAKVFLDTDPTSCQLSGYVLTPAQTSAQGRPSR